MSDERGRSPLGIATEAAPRRLPHVSSHAVVRFAQRILGVSLDEPHGASESELARLYAAAAGRSVDDIADEILSPAVRVGILAGFPQVATRRFRAFVAPTGTIRTILAPFPHAGGRLNIPTHKESERMLRRAVLRDRSMTIVLGNAG